MFTALKSKESFALTEKERTNWFTEEEISLLKSTLEGSDNLMDIQRRLVLALYTEMPPLRRDWAGVYLSNLPVEGDNTLSLESGVLTLYNYKTAGAYGVKEIVVPNPVLARIKNFISEREDRAIFSTYVLINSGGEPMLPNTLTNFVKGITPKGAKSLTINLLRKMYASKDVDLDYEKSRAELASAMCHSKETSLNYYCKDV